MKRKRTKNGYKKFMSYEERREQYPYYVPCVLVFLSMMVGLGLNWLGLSLQGKFIGRAMTLENLILGYLQWGWLSCILDIIAIALVIGFSIYAIAFLCSDKCNEAPRGEVGMIRGLTIQTVIVCLGIMLLITYAYFKEEKPFAVIKKFEQEYEKIQEKDYESAEVSLDMESAENENLWWISEDSPHRFISYSTVGNEAQVGKIYVPDYMKGDLATESFDNNKTNRGKNDKNAVRYRITYTPVFHIAVHIEAL